MCCLEGAKGRHPAGKLRERAERSPHDLCWALAKAEELGGLKEQIRIIELLDERLTTILFDELVALIRGENK